MGRHSIPLMPSASAVLVVAMLLLSCCFPQFLCDESGLSTKREAQHRRLLLPAPPSPASTNTLKDIPMTSRKPTKQEQASFRKIPPTSNNPTQNKSKPRKDGPGNLKNLRGRRR